MRIYAACLASHNNGVLHGAWVDASSDVEDMKEDIAAMLRASKFPNVRVLCPVCEGSEGVPRDNGCGTVRCPECDGYGSVASAEEWAIHDMEDLPQSLGEYCGLQAVADAVEFIEETGPNNGMTEDDARELLDDCCGDLDRARELSQEFMGRHDSFRDYAEEVADEMIACASADGNPPQFLVNYFDYESYARDLKRDMHVIDVPGGVLVFHNC